MLPLCLKVAYKAEGPVATLGALLRLFQNLPSNQLDEVHAAGEGPLGLLAERSEVDRAASELICG